MKCWVQVDPLIHLSVEGEGHFFPVLEWLRTRESSSESESTGPESESESESIGPEFESSGSESESEPES